MQGVTIDLSGKTAIVTGAARGIGAAVAEGLASHGASVTILDLPKQEGEAKKVIASIESAGGTAQFLGVDVRKVEAFSKTVSEVADQHGKLDIMVNNAGVAVLTPSLDVTLNEWDALHDVNLRAVFFGCQAAAREMIKTGGGKIINTASELAFVVSRVPVLAIYIASKGGVVTLTRALAVEWAEHKINVNAIAPGPTRTEMLRWAVEDPELYQGTIDEIPVGRMMEPQDMVGAAVFLASDLSEMVTGQVIPVDGGRSVT